MAPLSIPIKLILALILGAVIGLERESYEKKIDKSITSGVGSLGVRSFSLITLLGAIAGLVYSTHYSLYLLISIFFMVLLLTYYIIGSLFNKDNGITTELGIIFSFLIGIFVALDIFPVQLIVAIVIVIIGILSIKEKLHGFVSDIKSNELGAFLSYAIIALVILPFLPNQSYSLSSVPNLTKFLSTIGIEINSIINLPLINPFNIWKVVVIITGVDLFGYLLEKGLGKNKGWLVTSLVGGFVSSTSVTQSLALKSKNTTNSNKLVTAAIFTNLASFVQHFFLIATVNAIFLVRSIYYVGAIIITALIIGLYFFRKQKNSQDDLKDTKKSFEDHKIFSLGPALKFALIFFIVTLVTKFSLVLFGDQGFLITTALASITGLDASTINISQLAGSTISFQIGLLALIVANAVNLIAKTIYGFMQGSRDFSFKFALSISFIIIASFIGIIPLL